MATKGHKDAQKGRRGFRDPWYLFVANRIGPSIEGKGAQAGRGSEVAAQRASVAIRTARRGRWRRQSKDGSSLIRAVVSTMEELIRGPDQRVPQLQCAKSGAKRSSQNRGPSPRREAHLPVALSDSLQDLMLRIAPSTAGIRNLRRLRLRRIPCARPARLGPAGAAAFRLPAPNSRRPPSVPS